MLRGVKRIVVVNEAHQRLISIIKLRLPWLLIGLVGGTLASFIVSRFEDILVKNISLAFFLPIIVYMSDAVGTQTETIFVRDLSKHKLNFWKYLLKEIFIGITLGIILGILVGIIAKFWIGANEIALTVGIAMFANVVLAPIIAIIVPEILFKERSDPALGAGPFTTVLQDLISIFIYFVVATAILWNQFIF